MEDPCVYLQPIVAIDSPVALASALDRLQQAWASAVALGNVSILCQAFPHNAPRLGELLARRPLLPRNLLVSLMNLGATLAREVQRSALAGAAAGDLVACFAEVGCELEETGAEEATRAGLWIVARKLTRAADSSLLSSALLEDWLQRQLRAVAEVSEGRSTARAMEGQTGWTKAGAGALVAEVLDRHIRTSGAHATPALTALVPLLRQTSVADADLRHRLLHFAGLFPTVHGIAAEKESAEGGAAKDGHDRPSTTLRESTSALARAATFFQRTSETHAAPSPNELFTYEEVRDFLRTEAQAYRTEADEIAQRVAAETQMVADLERQLEDAEEALRLVAV